MPTRRGGSGLAAFALLFNAAWFGVSWWPIRYLNDLGLHSLWSSAIMYLFAFIGVFVYQPRALTQLIKHPGLWSLALATGGTNAAFNWGVTVGDVVRVVLLFYMMPIWVALLSRVMLAESIDRAGVLRMAVALLGAGIVLWEPGTTVPSPSSPGDWLGLIGGFCFAMTNILLKKYGDTAEQGRTIAMFTGGVLVPGILAIGLSAAGFISAPPMPMTSWLPSTALISCFFVLANLALLYGIPRLPINVTATIMISEVVFAALSASFIGEEHLSARTLMGGALIVASSLLAARTVRRSKVEVAPA